MGRTLLAIIPLILLCSLSAAGDSWTVSSFDDFNQGVLSDGGVNSYVAADGSVRLANTWDFNGDGAFDLPVTCPQDYTETPDLFVYFAGKDGFSRQRRLSLPAEGCVAGTAADLNKDGFTDLIVCNRFDGEKDNLDSFIYWGGKDGLSASRRMGLPTEAAMGAAVSDLNGDGWPDIVFANAGCDYHMTYDRRQRSFVYFGGENGFKPSRRLELKTINATSVAIADVDGDHIDDIVFSVEGNEGDEGGANIYYNDGKGRFSEKRSLFLPGLGSSDVAVGDLNNDSFPDIVLANRCKMTGKTASMHGDVVELYAVNSFVYWGSKNGYSTSRRAELPTSSTSGCVISDLNRDGLPDVVFSCGRGTLMNATGERTSYVYWNSPQGFAPSNRAELPTQSAQDCAAGDLNGDGYHDLVFANQEKGGLLNTDSRVYWGAKDGFSANLKTDLPTQGAFGVVLADLDGDGAKDVAFMNKREGTMAPPNYFVYTGDREGQFSRERRVELPAGQPDTFAVADLNADGFSDLFYPGTAGLIYWGSARGLSAESKTTLPTPGGGYTAAPVDLNRDGHLDLAVSGQKVFVLFGDQGNRFRKGLGAGLVLSVYVDYHILAMLYIWSQHDVHSRI